MCAAYDLCIYIVFFICDCFCTFFFQTFFYLVLKRQRKWWMVPASINCIFHFCMRAVPKGLTFGLCLHCFTFVNCACFVLFSTSVRCHLVKSPEVTLCGWRGYKPPINKLSIKRQYKKCRCVGGRGTEKKGWELFGHELTVTLVTCRVDWVPLDTSTCL